MRPWAGPPFVGQAGRGCEAVTRQEGPGPFVYSSGFIVSTSVTWLFTPFEPLLIIDSFFLQ